MTNEMKIVIMLAALQRLASMEAFEGARMINKIWDQELLARIKYAESILLKVAQ